MRKFWKSRSKAKSESKSKKKPPTQSPPTPVSLPPTQPHPLPVRIGQHRSGGTRTTTPSSPPSLEEMKQWTSAKKSGGERGSVQIGRGRTAPPPPPWTPGTMPQGTDRGPALLGRRRGTTPSPVPQIQVPPSPAPQPRGGYNLVDYTGIQDDQSYDYAHDDSVDLASTDEKQSDYTGIQNLGDYDYKYGAGSDYNPVDYTGIQDNVVNEKKKPNYNGVPDDESYDYNSVDYTGIQGDVEENKSDYTGVQNTGAYEYRYGSGSDGYRGVQGNVSDQDVVEEQQATTGQRASTTAMTQDLPAVRQHRAWMVSRLRKHYENELVEQRSDLVGAVNETAQLIKDYLQVIAALRQIHDNDPFALERALTPLPPINPVRKARRVDEALKIATRSLEKHLEKVRREDLPISEDGTVDSDTLGTRMVTYDDEVAQHRSTVLVGGGKLFRNDEKKTPVDTAKSVTHQTGPGAEIFVVSDANEIHMASHKLGRFHHSSLLGGKPVSMAGEMKVTAGKINWISNKSGHYAPSPDQLVQFLYHLGKDGVPLDFEVKGAAKTSYKPGTTAAQVVAGIGSDGTSVAKFGHDHLKTQSVISAWKAELKDDKPAFKAVFAKNDWYYDHDDDVHEVEDKKTGKPVSGQEIRDAFKRAFPGRKPREDIQR